MVLSLLKKIRTFSWTASAFLKKYGKITILSLIIGLMGFFFIGKIFPYLPKLKKEERIGLVGQYSLDRLPDEILNLLGQGLTSITKDGSAAPGLATNWNISEDGLIYTFTLKDKLFWQDDKEIKANEIVYNFKDVEREVIDDKTLSFKLKEPFSPFLVALSRPVFKKHLLGSGPYRISKMKKNGQNLSMLKLSGPKNIIFRFYPTVKEIELAFKLGEIDEIEGLFNNPFQKEWKKNIKIETQIKKDCYLGLFLNNKDPLLGSKDLRQALNYAIEHKADKKIRVYSPLNPTSWAYNSQVKTYDYNQEKAKNLLKKFNKDKKEKIKIKILTSQSFLSLAEDIKSSWRNVLGIETEIEIINFLPQDYQAFLGIQKIPVDPDQYILWHSTRQENVTHFNDPRIDKLLEDGRKIQDKEKRKEKYFDFQKFLLEESPVIFLNHPVLFKIRRRSLAF